MSPNAEELIGHVMGGYQLMRILGKGGTSVVFLAQKKISPDDQVAIKVLMPPLQLGTSELGEVRKRFAREARVLSQRLNHPHILPVLFSGEDEQSGYAFLVMPYIEGSTLTNYIPEAGLALDKVRHYLIQLADAVDYAHSENIIHRDIKPANILIDKHDRLYLADFGVLKVFNTDFTTLTEFGRVIGTPEYMAPEQAKGETVGPAADIYALAMIAYILVTGHLPYPPATGVSMLLQVISRAPTSPREYRPELSEMAETVLLFALNKDPKARFASAKEFLEAFLLGLEGKLVPPLPRAEQTLQRSPMSSPFMHASTPPLLTVPGPFVAKRGRNWLRSILLAFVIFLFTTGILLANGLFPRNQDYAGQLSFSPMGNRVNAGSTLTSQAATPSMLPPTTVPSSQGITKPSYKRTPLPSPIPSPVLTMAPGITITPNIFISPTPNDVVTPTAIPSPTYAVKPRFSVYMAILSSNNPVCGEKGQYDLEIGNQGDTVVDWSISTHLANYVISPSFGQLSPGQSTRLQASGPAVNDMVKAIAKDHEGDMGEPGAQLSCLSF